MDHSDLPLPGRRIHVVGTSGSGKTTLARKLADCLAIPHVELDALHWRPHWQEAPDAEMREEVRRWVQEEAWVVDGNYSKMRDLVWARADTVVWLDLPLWQMMSRLWARTLRRMIRQEPLWHGNRESWRMAFFSKDSILLWQLSTYKRRRRQYRALMSEAPYPHLQWVHLRSARQAKRWLRAVCQSARLAGAEEAPATARRL